MDNVVFLSYETGQNIPVETLLQAVYHSFRSHRRDRVAIMGRPEDLESLRGRVDANYLDLTKDYQWTGVQRRVQTHWKRIMLGDYASWFQWYMRYQRFKAFQVVVLVNPLAGASGKDYGGYVDGLIARVSGKAVSIIVVKPNGPPQAVDPDLEHVQELLLALIYGRRLSKSELPELARLAPTNISVQLMQEALDRSRWLIRKYHSRYQLTESAEEFVQGMEHPRSGHREEPTEVRSLFRRHKRFIRDVMIPDAWVNEKVLADIREKGWVTVAEEKYGMPRKLEQMAQEGDPHIRRLFEGFYLSDEQASRALVTSLSQVRRVLDSLVAEGVLTKRKWFREVGRPALAYCLPDRVPFIERRCGQCAFYVSLRRRCRLWWLVDKVHGHGNPRWKEPGSTVSRFDVHKMNNSWRIGPHSSACTRFIDKKMDHLRNEFPPECEICGRPLRQRKTRRMVSCSSCGTKYFAFRDKVKVLTAYEHEFERLYREITRNSSRDDLKTWREEQAQRTPQLPGELERVTDERSLQSQVSEASRERARRRLPSFDATLQEQVDRLAKTTDVGRKMATAMAQSAIIASRRIVSYAKLDEALAQKAVRLQERYLSLLEDADPRSFLTYEALIMKQYWSCYDLALKPALAWFGPRKKARFVREFVESPEGRARGYTAVDAAINYLHQRRLAEAAKANAEVGFGERSCEGFLHRKHHNSSGIGLLLDVIDPFKFADREQLLLVVLAHGTTWRDFRMEIDRSGSNFYYPAKSAQSVLDQVGEDADNLVVRYMERDMRLTEAYRVSATNLLVAVTEHDVERAYRPFVFGNKEDFEMSGLIWG